MWFTYGLYYIKEVQDLTQAQTGLVILSGQIADGIATTIVGIFSDKTNTRCGRRMPWYIFGTIVVYPCFFGIFYDCFACKMTNNEERRTTGTIYFCLLAAIFNVGWASVQIATMSIVNSLTYSQRKRDIMVSDRNGFRYTANFGFLVLALIIFATVKDNHW